MKKILYLSVILLFVPSLIGRVGVAIAQNHRQIINLAGTWKTELGDINLPGTTDTNRKGNALQKKDETTHLSRLYSYVGELSWH